MCSKTLRPEWFGDTREAPDQVIIALKAWMWFRMQANNFLDKKIRREVWAREIALLRKEVLEREGVGSLGQAAQSIREWAPQVLV